MKSRFSQKIYLVRFVSLSLVSFAFFNNCSAPMHSENSQATSASQQAAFKCTDRDLSSKTKNYILSKTQYMNTLEDLFGTPALAAITSELSTIADDSYNDDTNERLSTISSAQAIAYYDTAAALANYVISNTTRTQTVFGSCANLASPTATCIDTYINGFARRILRRPLTVIPEPVGVDAIEDEVEFVKKIMSTSGTYKENLKAVLTYHLSSPAFLWLLETGTTSSTGTRLALTPYEVSTRLAYLLTDSTPDATLTAAAQDSSILTPVGLQTQVQRLLKTTRGKKKVADAIKRWSLTDKVQDVTGLPTSLTTGVSTSGITAAIQSEVQTYIDHIVYQSSGSLKELMTSKLSFANHAGLATIHGHAPVVGGVPVTMSQRRQGILMRTPFLTWYTPRTNIILRGVAFQKRVLCNEIPSPNVDIVGDRDAHVLTDTDLVTVTNRAAVTYQTDAPVCMRCHSMINPVGFAYESFDSLGRIRTQEMLYDRSGNYVQSVPVHTNTQVPMPDGGSVSVSDAYDLITTLADSPEIAACVSRNVFRHFYEKKETQQDDCQIQDGFEVAKDPSLPLLNAIEKIFSANSLYYKEL